MKDKNTEDNFKYSVKPITAIWDEKPGDINPYIAKEYRMHGYDLLSLMKKKSFVEVFYLLFCGELPTKDQLQLLEALMIFLINPGPRHSATRAAMSAGVSKADHAHILPIGMIAMGGDHLGSSEVEKSIKFFNKNQDSDPIEISKKLLNDYESITEGDCHIAPGFGSRYNSIDNISVKMANHLIQLPGAGNSLKWGKQFSNEISNKGMSWLNTGIAAAVFSDLGVGAREGAGLFQLMSAPGILAHGLEQTHKPITAMPMLQDEDYVIEK